MRHDVHPVDHVGHDRRHEPPPKLLVAARGQGAVPEYRVAEEEPRCEDRRDRMPHIIAPDTDARAHRRNRMDETVDQTDTAENPAQICHHYATPTVRSLLVSARTT